MLNLLRFREVSLQNGFSEKPLQFMSPSESIISHRLFVESYHM